MAQSIKFNNNVYLDANSVVVDNTGTKLPDVLGVSVNYPSTEVSPQTVPTNADMLGGLPASDYVKYTDEHIGDIGVEYPSTEPSPQTVPTNAEMLGGLAASQYVLHTDALSLEEIEASTSLTGKVASAESVKEVSSKVNNQEHRWLRFDPSNRRGVKILKGTSVRLANGALKTWSVDTLVDLSSYIDSNGTDYFVFVDNDGVVSAQTSSVKVNAVKIGRFHTLCVNAGTMTMIAPASPSSGLSAGGKYLVKPYDPIEDADFYAFYNKTISAVTVQSEYDVVTCEHPLSGFVAKDILPESVFCLGFHPDCLIEDAMVYDKTTDRCIDVYLYSGKGEKTTSKYNATHTVSRRYYNIQQDFLQVGKRCLYDSEFTSAALGSNERTNITGSSDKGTVGGHVDTSNRRMISAIGCEEMCGYLWQVLSDIGPVGGSGWGSTDAHGTFGQEYGTPYVVLAGVFWIGGSYSGSRSRYSGDGRSGSDSSCGGRGSSRVAR